MTDRERQFLDLGIDYGEGIDLFDSIVLPNGREVRRTPGGRWEVQPKNDNYWVSFDDLLEAVKCGSQGRKMT